MHLLHRQVQRVARTEKPLDLSEVKLDELAPKLKAIANLGKDGGFLNNLDVKIPLPDELKKVEKLLRILEAVKFSSGSR